jgi:hypothetical protein
VKKAMCAIAYLNQEVKSIEEKVLSLVKKEQQKQLTVLTSIPGMRILFFYLI